jgi:hypothetical protein
MKKYLLILLFISLIPVSAYCKSQSAQEFIDGKKKTYNTVGNPKAKGLHLSIEYPEGWSAAQGNRPNVPQKFVSEKGKGLEMLVIVVRNMPNDLQLSKDDIDAMFTPESLAEIVPDAAIYVGGKPITIDGLSGGWANYIQRQERLGLVMKSISDAYVFYYDKRLIFLIFSVSGIDADETMDRYNWNVPLFKMMVNSLILHDQYK